MSKWMRIATISAVGAWALLASDNLTGAKEHEAKAELLEAKAKRHEARAEDLANRKGYNPMAHKWPAMVQGPIDRERQLAAKARRTAHELRELAAKERKDSSK
jgi:hypothetical protein